MSRRNICQLIAIGCLLIIAFALLGAKDASAFLRWYLMVFLIGLGFFPLTRILFRSFADGGWIFSKALGIVASGFVVWLLSSVGILDFTNRRSLVITLIVIGLIWSFFLFRAAEEERPDVNLVLREEIVFLAIFLVWTYIAGFRPEARGTEKYMDYGLVASMMRSTKLPARDMWYGTDPVNYYYGGQYFTAYLSKITWTSVKQTYNLMRMLVAAFAFSMPFSLVRQLLADRLQGHRRVRIAAAAGGVVAGIAVSFAGNMHYVLYGLFGGLFRLPGSETYWFPDSTRYIGHNPPTADQCIHEFPSYSFVLGDLHAHVVNLLFVLLVLGLLYAWMSKVRAEEPSDRVRGFRMILAEPHLLIAGAIVGLFRWTNYWDFAIYFTVLLIAVVVVAVERYPGEPAHILFAVLVHLVEIFLVGAVAALPFTAGFDMIAGSIGIAAYHSAPYQLLILWGFPALIVVILLVQMILSLHRKQRAEGVRKEWGFSLLARRGVTGDVFALMLGCCAIGLVLIPELVYVRDIYEKGYSRSNTMFKLTYQAFVFFGIVIGYALVHFFCAARRWRARIPAVVLAALFALTVPYGAYAISCWYGNVFDRSRYAGLTADAFLEEVYPEDAAAIRWLDENLEGQPLVLEAEGDSYSDYGRVSAMTGLPTVQGWYVHEWLWRGEPETLTTRAADIEKIYTSDSADEVRALLRKYHVEYVFVGSMERERYGEINNELLLSLGTPVFGDEDATYVLRM